MLCGLKQSLTRLNVLHAGKITFLTWCRNQSYLIRVASLESFFKWIHKFTWMLGKCCDIQSKVKSNLRNYVIKHYATKGYGGVEVPFLTWGVDGDDWSASRPWSPRYPWSRRLGGSRAGLDAVEEGLPPAVAYTPYRLSYVYAVWQSGWSEARWYSYSLLAENCFLHIFHPDFDVSPTERSIAAQIDWGVL
jgi:hypothetical protein